MILQDVQAFFIFNTPHYVKEITTIMTTPKFEITCVKALLIVMFGILIFYMMSVASGLYLIVFTTARTYDIDMYTGCHYGDTIMFNQYGLDECIDNTTNTFYPIMQCSLRSGRSLWGECLVIGALAWIPFMVLISISMIVYVLYNECAKCIHHRETETKVETKIVIRPDHTKSVDDIDIELDSTSHHHTKTNDVMIDISLDRDESDNKHDDGPIGLESGSI